MIPKIIHYCWFGSRGFSPLNEYCIASWKRNLPEYTFKLWNEENFDFSKSQFARESYEKKKFAFVSDYVRLHALYEEGGIYLDTDCEVLRPFDDLLSLPAFACHECDNPNRNDNPIGMGTIGAMRQSAFVRDLLNLYQKPFILPFGELDTLPNPQKVAKAMTPKGLCVSGVVEIKDYATIFSRDYFLPTRIVYNRQRIPIVTKNTYVVHHYEASWANKRQKIAWFFTGKFGRNCGGVVSYLLFPSHLFRKMAKFLIRKK